MDFESISLATRTQCHKVKALTHKSATIAACKSRACKNLHMFPRRFGSERLLVFPFPRQPNCSPGGRGENVCLASLSHNRHMAFQVFWERAPSHTAAKWLSRWSGRERLLGFPPSGLGENVCLVSLSHNRQMALQVVCERTLVSLSHNRHMAFLVAWERASAWLPSPQPPNGSPGGLG